MGVAIQFIYCTEKNNVTKITFIVNNLHVNFRPWLPGYSSTGHNLLVLQLNKEKLLY